MSHLTDADRAVVSRALRNHATYLHDSDLSTHEHIHRLRRIADALDPQKALPIEVLAVPA